MSSLARRDVAALPVPEHLVPGTGGLIDHTIFGWFTPIYTNFWVVFVFIFSIIWCFGDQSDDIVKAICVYWRS